MTEIELNNLLGKIGKRIFVQYFQQFSDPQLTNQDVIALLPSEYTFKSRTSCTSKSRRIIREGLAKDALFIIASSDRVEPEAAIEARELLRQL